MMLAALAGEIDRDRVTAIYRPIRLYVLNHMIHASNENIDAFLTETAKPNGSCIEAVA